MSPTSSLSSPSPVRKSSVHSRMTSHFPSRLPHTRQTGSPWSTTRVWCIDGSRVRTASTDCSSSFQRPWSNVRNRASIEGQQRDIMDIWKLSSASWRLPGGQRSERMSGNMWEAVEYAPSSTKTKNQPFTLQWQQPSSQEGGIYGGSSVPTTPGIESTREEPRSLPRDTQVGIVFHPSLMVPQFLPTN